MIALKYLWIVLSYLVVPQERYQRLHGLTSCRFYVGLLARVCFVSCEYYYAVANTCFNVDISQVLPCLLTFRKAGCRFWCLDGTRILNVLVVQLFGRH
jgi:hypothetical protein